MATCLGKSCSLCLLWVSFMNVYQFVCLLLFFMVLGWDVGLIVFIPDHRLSFYFDSFNFISLD